MSNIVNVTAKRWEKGWELHVDGFGVTQSHTLAAAEGMVRDYIADNVDNVAAVDIVINVAVPESEEAAKLRAELDAIDESLGRAAARSRALAKRLKARGMSGADMAVVMGVSPQRISQLLKP